MVVEYSAEQEASIDVALAREAASTLFAWRSVVSDMPGWARTAEHAEALEALVRWYEQTCADPGYAEPPPLEGLDVLTDELTTALSDDGRHRFARARWAVRVAEELVRLRACHAHHAQVALMRMAGHRLELSLIAARQYFDGEPMSPQT